MSDLSEFVFEDAALSRLPEAMGKESLGIAKLGEPEEHKNGTEQGWKCFDNSGDLFRFVTVLANEKNTLGVKKGQIYLVVVPLAKGSPKRKRKETADGFERFERAMIALNARRKNS